MTQVFANNAQSTLASSANASTTSLILAPGTGSLFPTPSGGDFFTLTLTQAGVETSWEIVRVTARSGDTLTVVRAQESTSAAAWDAGSKAELRLTAGVVWPPNTGGTGVANPITSTLTLGGALQFVGAFTAALTLTANTALTLPTAGTVAVTSQIPTANNPTAQVGLTAANGLSSDYMRADAAPALNQGISPTWTAPHTFNSPVTGASFIPTSNSVPQNGLYLESANTPAIASNGSGRLVFESDGTVRPRGNATQDFGSASFLWATYRGVNMILTSTANASAFIPTSSAVPANGLYLPAANTPGLSAGGNEVLRGTSNGSVGIGTSNPLARLHVNTNATPNNVSALADAIIHVSAADAAGAQILVDTFGSVPRFTGRRAQGTAAAKTALQANQNILVFDARGYGSTGYSSDSRGSFRILAAETWNDTAQGTYFSILTTTAGTTTLTERVRVTDAGNTQLRADNQELQIGAGQDLRLYHDGTDSIVENDTGNLVLKVNGELSLAEVSTTTTAPGAGGAGALPATPAEYVTIIVNGTTRKLAVY